MNKWICLFLIFATSSVHSDPLRDEITNNKVIRSILRVCVKRSYQDTEVHADVRSLPAEPRKGTVLLTEQLDKYFYDEANTVLPGYKNSFKGGGVRGCIYSIDDPLYQNKIFITFPGTVTTLEWAKNFFGITSFDHNIQRSYHDDIDNLYAHHDNQAFLTALHKHVNSKSSNYKDLNNDKAPDSLSDYEYYFTGHSRGGGLAIVAGIMFKEKNALLPIGNVKLATFCAPRVTNAHKVQSKFINLIGYDNIVNFVRPFDLAQKFPFQFVENQGVQIPLQPNAFWSIKKSHRIPDEKEVETSVEKYNSAKGIGWLYPIRNLFTLEPKPLVWGVGGVCISLLLIKTSLGSLVSGEIKEMYIRMLRKI